MTLDEIAERFQSVRWSGDKGFSCRCPAHDDQHNSLSVNNGDKGVVVMCHACGKERTKDILAAVGLTFADLMNGNGDRAGTMNIVGTYSYQDQDGREVHQVVRLRPKDFRARRSDGNGGWIWNLKDVPRVLYRLPDLVKSDLGTVVHVVEGEKDVDRLRALGLVATCNPGGAGKWRDDYNHHLKGRHVIIIPDYDVPGVEHARNVARHLHGTAASVKIITLYSGPIPEKHGKDISNWLAEGHDSEELVRLAEAAPEWAPAVTAAPEATSTLPALVQTFRAWLHLPDVDPLYAVLGAVAANRRPGDPVWIMVVGASSRGKSEIIGSTSKLPDIFPAATLTEASLLSGTPKREKAPDAKGGLLRQIGDYGIIACKDFGSVLNMSRDPRASVLAALREVYDGAWTRHVGTDGGRTLHWQGKVGFIGGCTPNIDRHHAVMSSMGERFCFVRLPDQDDAELARRALRHAGHEAAMRAELSAAVSGLYNGINIDAPAPELTDEEQDRLIALTTLSVRCRSTVERDTYSSREIELVPGAESPGRLIRVAANLLAALHVIGLDRPDAWRVVTRVILDSMPALRRRVLTIVANNKTPITTVDVAETAGYPTTTTRRQLEELAAYAIVRRQGQGQGKADLWNLTEWTDLRLNEIGTLPEMSGGMR